ncbi:polar amino acid transport system substrate-binding protein [Pseudoalteromonas denitrificans DSM 6059]|uniref:Polar amino acid transport system substrate-binding protein n=2 Tax=Pseudoalteromonas TaxID=53246 RepID=A0A1I1TFA5_9GAMM|nr:polar amino acid transport system substrate-binding protein [Pseudoalteromonas denitrificans DSM 6059]
MHIRFCILVLFLCVVMFPVMAKKHVIACGELSSLCNGPTKNNNTSSGSYYEMLSRILDETKLSESYELIVMPIARAKRGFINRQFACYSPGVETFDNVDIELNNLALLSSQPINQAVVRVISRPSDPLVSNVKGITREGSISIVRGVPVNSTIKSMINRARAVFEVNSELENIKMLMSKRVKWSISFYPDVIDAYKKLGLIAHFPFDSKFSPLIISDNIICHKSHTAAFEKIKVHLMQMKKSGVLKDILKDKYMIAPEL